MTIDEFITSQIAGDCRLLRRLYEFDRNARANKRGYIGGLTLLTPEPYGGTILYDPTTTPTNSIAFATTCGDDVHFGLVAREQKFSDSSPVVVTVPMAGDFANTNHIVGETLHDFLCLGCVHGFFDLEKLAYSWRAELFETYAEPPTTDDEPIYAQFRAEFALTPWTDIEHRLRQLNAKYLPLLQFGSD